MAVADFNGDAKADLAVAAGGAVGIVTVRLGSGLGAFTAVPDVT